MLVVVVVHFGLFLFRGGGVVRVGDVVAFDDGDGGMGRVVVVGLGWDIAVTCRLWCFAGFWGGMVLLASVALRNYTNTWWVEGWEWWWAVPGRWLVVAVFRRHWLDVCPGKARCWMGASGEEVGSHRQTRGAGHSGMKSSYIQTILKVQCDRSRGGCG